MKNRRLRLKKDVVGLSPVCLVEEGGGCAGGPAYLVESEGKWKLAVVRQIGGREVVVIGFVRERGL